MEPRRSARRHLHSAGHPSQTAAKLTQNSEDPASMRDGFVARRSVPSPRVVGGGWVGCGWPSTRTRGALALAESLRGNA